MFQYIVHLLLFQADAFLCSHQAVFLRCIKMASSGMFVWREEGRGRVNTTVPTTSATYIQMCVLSIKLVCAGSSGQRGRGE